MSGKWKEVVRLRFKGKRFRGHALDLSALTELSEFQKLVAETAKELWRASHPTRERLPSHFEDRTRLCLRSIEDGSAVVPLEVFIEKPEECELWEPEPVEVQDAINLAHEVFDSVEHDRPLPNRFPKQLVDNYAKWGQSLSEDEEIEFQPPGKSPTHITAIHRERLAAFSETPYEDAAEVRGEVFEADVRQRRFQLWLDDNTAVSISFNEAQEELVTSALKDHKSLRLHVNGRGEFSSAGKLRKFTVVHEITIQRLGPIVFNTAAPTIEDELSAIASEIPHEDWDNLPSDLTDDLDHYLYGTPKQ